MKLYGATKFIHLVKDNQHIYLIGELHFLHFNQVLNTQELSDYLISKLSSQNSKLFLELNDTENVSKIKIKAKTLKNIVSVFKKKTNRFVREKVDLYDSREKVLREFIPKKNSINNIYSPLFYSNRVYETKIKFFNIKHIFQQCIDLWENSAISTKFYFQARFQAFSEFYKYYENFLHHIPNKNSSLKNEIKKGLYPNKAKGLIDFTKNLLAMLQEMNLLNKLDRSKHNHNYVLIGTHHIPNIAFALK